MKLLLYTTILLTSANWFTGCITFKACENKFGPCGDITPVSVTETVRDTLVITKADTLRETFTIPIFRVRTDSVIQKSWTAPRTFTRGNVTVTWLSDSTLLATAVCKSDTVKIKGVDRFKTITQWKDRTIEKETSWWAFWWLVLIGVGIGALVTLFSGRR